MKIALERIVVVHNHRQVFGGIAALADDIRKNGLLEPIGVRARPDGTFSLCYGERRLRALRRLAAEQPERWSEVECVLRSEGSAIDDRFAALSENSARRSISWFELGEELRALQLETGLNYAELAARTGYRNRAYPGRLIRAVRDLAPIVVAEMKRARRFDVPLDEAEKWIKNLNDTQQLAALKTLWGQTGKTHRRPKKMRASKAYLRRLLKAAVRAGASDVRLLQHLLGLRKHPPFPMD